MTNAIYVILFLLLMGGVPAAQLALLHLGRGRKRQLAEVPPLPPAALIAARALPAHPYREPGRPALPSPPRAEIDVPEELIALPRSVEPTTTDSTPAPSLLKSAEIALAAKLEAPLSLVPEPASHLNAIYDIIGEPTRGLRPLARPAFASRERIVALSVTADRAGDETIRYVHMSRSLCVRDFWATDWTEEVAKGDPAYAERCLALAAGQDVNPSPPEPREWWVTDEPPVEAPKNLDIDDAATLAYLRAVRDRDERKVRARVHPAPGTSTEIAGLFNGCINFFPTAPQAGRGVPTATYASWTPFGETFQGGTQVTVQVRFKRPGTFLIVFRGHEVEQPAFGRTHIFGQEG